MEPSSLDGLPVAVTERVAYLAARRRRTRAAIPRVHGDTDRVRVDATALDGVAIVLTRNDGTTVPPPDDVAPRFTLREVAVLVAGSPASRDLAAIVAVKRAFPGARVVAAGVPRSQEIAA